MLSDSNNHPTYYPSHEGLASLGLSHNSILLVLSPLRYPRSSATLAFLPLINPGLCTCWFLHPAHSSPRLHGPDSLSAPPPSSAPIPNLTAFSVPHPVLISLYNHNHQLCWLLYVSHHSASSTRARCWLRALLMREAGTKQAPLSVSVTHIHERVVGRWEDGWMGRQTEEYTAGAEMDKWTSKQTNKKWGWTINKSTNHYATSATPCNEDSKAGRAHLDGPWGKHHEWSTILN